MKTWDVTKTNDTSPLAVLKKMGLLGPGGEPLQPYADFMQPPPSGPRALGARIKEHYAHLFETLHEPHKKSTELRTFFNINAGGGERAIEYQMQTFKALSDYADFTNLPDAATTVASDGPIASSPLEHAGQGPTVRVDLHIHLPDNKTARDYEAIIQDIARYIYGRTGDRG